MGDVADAMLDGTLCQSCGEFIDDVADGYPRTCGGCQMDETTRQPRTQAEMDAYSRECQERAREKRRAKKRRQRERRRARLDSMQDCTRAIKAIRLALPDHRRDDIGDMLDIIDEHRRELERLAGLRQPPKEKSR